MDETSRAIIEKITVRYEKPVKLPSGHEVRVFFDTARLCPNDLARLAAEATGHLEHDAFDLALGVAYNGIFFAAAVAGGREAAILQADGCIYGPALKGKRVVLVSDVVCEGRQLRESEKVALAHGADVLGYACIVDRSQGAFDKSAKPLWSAVQVSLTQ